MQKKGVMTPNQAAYYRYHKTHHQMTFVTTPSFCWSSLRVAGRRRYRVTRCRFLLYSSSPLYCNSISSLWREHIKRMGRKRGSLQPCGNTISTARANALPESSQYFGTKMMTESDRPVAHYQRRGHFQQRKTLIVTFPRGRGEQCAFAGATNGRFAWKMRRYLPCWRLYCVKSTPRRLRCGRRQCGEVCAI